MIRQGEYSGSVQAYIHREAERAWKADKRNHKS
jgi:hypothetical protein